MDAASIVFAERSLVSHAELATPNSKRTRRGVALSRLGGLPLAFYFLPHINNALSYMMDAVQVSELLVWMVRLAGLFHFVTLTIACFTPIPPGWDENLAKLPDVHRRFAIAQNVFIGGVIAVCGFISVIYAKDLVSGDGMARTVSASIALWWLARLLVLPFLKVTPHLTTSMLRIGFVMLHFQCATYAVGFGWLAFR